VKKCCVAREKVKEESTRSEFRKIRKTAEKNF